MNLSLSPSPSCVPEVSTEMMPGVRVELPEPPVELTGPPVELPDLPVELLRHVMSFMCHCSGVTDTVTLGRASQVSTWMRHAAQERAERATRALLQDRIGEYSPHGGAPVSILLHPTWAQRLDSLLHNNIAGVCLLYLQLADDESSGTIGGIIRKIKRILRKVDPQGSRLYVSDIDHLPLGHDGGQSRYSCGAGIGGCHSDATVLELPATMPRAVKLWLCQCLGLHSLAPVCGFELPTRDLIDEWLVALSQPLPVNVWETLATRTRSQPRLGQGHQVDIQEAPTQGHTRDSWRLPCLAPHADIVVFQTQIVERCCWCSETIEPEAGVCEGCVFPDGRPLTEDPKAARALMESEGEMNDREPRAIFELRRGPMGDVKGRAVLGYCNCDYEHFERVGPTIESIDSSDLDDVLVTEPLLRSITEWVFVHFPKPARLQADSTTVTLSSGRRRLFRNCGWRETQDGDWSILLHDAASAPPYGGIDPEFEDASSDESEEGE